jgi:RNA polymerase sigma-70 factor (ECF subfamily)
MARGGEEAAFHELVSRYANDMFRLAFSLVGNAADAEDVVQETFWGVFRGLEAFEERSSVKTWLTRIVVRQAARSRKNRSLRKALSLDRISATSGGTRPAPEPTATPAALDTRIDVLAMLDTLSVEHRQIIVLREMQGMSYDEIAESLDVPRGTVESRLFRARQVLRDRLKDYLP